MGSATPNTAVAAAGTDRPVAAGPLSGHGPTILGAVAVTALFAWVFSDFIARQVRWAIEFQADWGHTLVIPFIAGYFVWLRRADLRRIGFRTNWAGLVLVIAGIGWYSLCVFGPQPLWHHNLRGAGVGLTITGIALLFCGLRAMTVLLFPIAYLVIFGQTISDVFLERFTQLLQDLTARASQVALILTGLDVDRTGNVLLLWERGAAEPSPLNIAEACSGMRMLMAFLALGVAMAYIGLDRLWQRVLLVLLAFPVALVVNILRVVTLAWLSRLDSDLAAGDFHTFVGLVWLVPAFLLFLSLQWTIRSLGSPRRPAAATASGKGSR